MEALIYTDIFIYICLNYLKVMQVQGAMVLINDQLNARDHGQTGSAHSFLFAALTKESKTMRGTNHTING